MGRRQAGLPLFVYEHSLKGFLGDSPGRTGLGASLQGAALELLLKPVCPVATLTGST